ncbi:hypothetical protein KOW79_021930 [Hemibagrus wyckioides]|uniref:SHSP domain-containing protein n=1 Tax=Hemibagrus wyckioides TaxID=337641 RepID=A0A9D3N577_9TELE|nr:hypothetical protein KOW79_021930 [Hemibagrus wyckioides]
MARPLFSRNGSWDPLQDWPRSSVLDQCRGAPFFLESDDEVSPSPGDGRQFSDVICDSKTWRISLDVSHFDPEEVDVKINKGYLEIAGKHEERYNNHGSVSRSFTRKYKLPTEVDLQKMNTSLSPEGVLLVEVY